MKANKKTAFIFGIIATLGAIFIENNAYHFVWAAALLIPGILLFTVGIDQWKSWVTEHRTSVTWPSNSNSWRVLRMAWLRIFIFFPGACTAGLINGIYNQV